MTKLNQELLCKITEYVSSNEDIGFLSLIGSNSNSAEINDEYSDIDLIIVTNSLDKYYTNAHWLNCIDEVWVSFVESNPEINYWERRCVFRNGLDIDFVIVEMNKIQRVDISFPVLNEICHDSMQVIIDKNNYRQYFNRFIDAKRKYIKPTEAEFENVVNDFYFHYLWGFKKCLRGEYWVALQCVNGYLKNKTLKMIEWYEHSLYGVDYNTFYQGRYIEKWVEDSIRKDFSEIFCIYEKESIIKALNANKTMFTKIAEMTGDMNGYIYPKNKIDRLTEWVNDNYKT